MDEQTACMTALAVPYIVLMVFGFAVISCFILVKVRLGLGG